MAIQSSLYTVDGSTRTFPSTKHIATKQHVAVYLKRVADSVWVLATVESFSLVNNAVVFDTAPDTIIYSQIEVRVADTANELQDAPSDIALVAGSITNVNAVASNLTNIDTVATNIGSVNTVSANIASVTNVSGHITDVVSVSSDLVAINEVVANKTNIDLNATNIVAIQNASANALATAADVLLTHADVVLTHTDVGLTNANVLLTHNSELAAAASAASIDPLTIVRKDSDTGAASIPYGTTAQRPTTPTVGYMRFNTTLSSAEVWNGTMWTPVGGGATGGGADTVFVETSYTVTQNYTLTTGKSAMTVGNANGDVVVNDGVTVTIPDGSQWTILGV